MNPGHQEPGVLSMKLELPAALVAGTSESDSLTAALRQSIERRITELLESLGIAGACHVEIAIGDGLANHEPLRLTLGETRVRYSGELLQRLDSYVRDVPLDPQASGQTITKWLSEQWASVEADRRALAVEFLSLACIEMLKVEPAVLFGLDQARDLAHQLPAAQDPSGSPQTWASIEPVWLHDVLGRVLDLGVSIGDLRTVASVLAAGLAARRDAASLAEDLIEALWPDVIEIQLPASLLREVTTGMGTEDAGVFPFLREGLFEELGLELPKLRFVVNDSLRPRTFCCKVNHLATLPLRALAPGELLVNDTVDRLKLTGIDAIPTSNPASNQPGSILDIGRRDQVQATGLTTWNQIQHLILCLADHVRQKGYCLVHKTWVQARLRRLGSAFPALLAGVRAGWSDDEITAVVRGLIRDGLSVRNWREILDRLVTLDIARQENVSPLPSSSEYVREDPLAFVRIGLARQIAHTAARQTDTVVVYLLDVAIERLTIAPASPDAERADAILEAFEQEMAHLPPTAQRPHVLTVVEARRPLQKLLRSRFPRMSVIAHEELPPGINVQPVARIQMQ